MTKSNAPRDRSEIREEDDQEVTSALDEARPDQFAGFVNDLISIAESRQEAEAQE